MAVAQRTFVAFLIAIEAPRAKKCSTIPRNDAAVILLITRCKRLQSRPNALEFVQGRHLVQWLDKAVQTWKELPYFSEQGQRVPMLSIF